MKFKGLITNLTCLQLRNTAYGVFFSIPVAVNLMVSRRGLKWSASNITGAIGPISDSLKWDIAPERIEKKNKPLKAHRIPELETLLWPPM